MSATVVGSNNMKLYQIYIYNNYEDREAKETIAIATTPENRDEIVEIFNRYVSMFPNLNEKWREILTRSNAAIHESVELFPKPKPTRHPLQAATTSTVELIQYRKEQLEKGNVEQAQAVLDEINEINERNYRINRYNQGLTEEYQATCDENDRNRDKYVYSKLTEQEHEFLREVQNMPFSDIGIGWDEIESDTFFTAPHFEHLVNKLALSLHNLGKA